MAMKGYEWLSEGYRGLQVAIIQKHSVIARQKASEKQASFKAFPTKGYRVLQGAIAMLLRAIARLRVDRWLSMAMNGYEWLSEGYRWLQVAIIQNHSVIARQKASEKEASFKAFHSSSSFSSSQAKSL